MSGLSVSNDLCLLHPLLGCQGQSSFFETTWWDRVPTQTRQAAKPNCPSVELGSSQGQVRCPAPGHPRIARICHPGNTTSTNINVLCIKDQLWGSDLLFNKLHASILIPNAAERGNSYYFYFFYIGLAVALNCHFAGTLWSCTSQMSAWNLPDLSLFAFASLENHRKPEWSRERQAKTFRETDPGRVVEPICLGFRHPSTPSPEIKPILHSSPAVILQIYQTISKYVYKHIESTC